MISSKNLLFMLALTLCIAPAAVAKEVSMAEAEHQIKAQLHDHPNAIEHAIARMRKFVNGRKLVNQDAVTSCIVEELDQLGHEPAPESAPMTESDRDLEEAILNSVKEESKKDAQQENRVRADEEFARVLEASKKDAYAKIFEQHPVYGLVIKKIQALQQLPITQLFAIEEQNQHKSGAHCVRNAWAIASLLEQNKAITAENIQQEAHKHPEIIPAKDNHNTKADVITQAFELNLLRTYYIECTDNKLIGDVINPGSYLQSFSNLHVQQLLKELKDKNQWVVSFICRRGDRHFLVAVVKETNKPSVMLYLDPQNQQLEKDSAIHKCVQEIHRICIEKSPLTKFLSSIKRSFVYPVLNTVKRIAQWVTNLF